MAPPALEHHWRRSHLAAPPRASSRRKTLASEPLPAPPSSLPRALPKPPPAIAAKEASSFALCANMEGGGHAVSFKKSTEDHSSAAWVVPVVTGFTFTVVNVVHLAGGKISEGNLWHHLRRLGLNENDANHPIFGHLKQALESLVQQRYLQKEKCNGPEGNSLMYELAERALDESFSEKLKDYIAQIANKDAADADVDD